MPNLSLKEKSIAIAVVVVVILIYIFLRGVSSKPDLSTSSDKKTVPIAQISQNDKPQIISTKPNPLEENIISAADTIEITFNRPLENVGEFKSRLEPNLEYKVELSGDRKTAKIKPVKGFLLGTTYTLFIGPETKFDGVGRWGEEKIFHFKTITYRGV